MLRRERNIRQETVNAIVAYHNLNMAEKENPKDEFANYIKSREPLYPHLAGATVEGLRAMIADFEKIVGVALVEGD